MTSTDVAVTENYPVGTVAAERVRLAEQVRVAVLFEGRQHDVTLPASSPVAAVADSLVRVLLTREGSDDGEGLLLSPSISIARALIEHWHAGMRARSACPPAETGR